MEQRTKRQNIQNKEIIKEGRNIKEGTNLKRKPNEDDLCIYLPQTEALQLQEAYTM
jgi:hypothetical protein